VRDDEHSILSLRGFDNLNGKFDRLKEVTKQRMAALMKTSRAQVDRLLDPDNGGATIESLQRAARIVGRELRLQLV
jgi:hypothetical protein